MAKGVNGCGRERARPRGGPVPEELLRTAHSSLTIRFGTDAPYRIGTIGFERVGYANIPMLVVPVEVPANAIDALVPIARQAAFAYLAERGVPDGALAFACSVKMGRKRRFADGNESSQSYGRNKMGLTCQYRFECTPMLTSAVAWGPSGLSSYGTLKATWELAADTPPASAERLLISPPPGRERCPSSGAVVRGIFQYGTAVTCPGCGRRVGTRRFSALTHSAHIAAHKQP